VEERNQGINLMASGIFGQEPIGIHCERFIASWRASNVLPSLYDSIQYIFNINECIRRITLHVVLAIYMGSSVKLLSAVIGRT